MRPRIPIGGYGEIAFIARGKGKVEARTRLRDWDGRGQLGQVVEVTLGTSARIGEVLAIRRRDLDLTTTPATLRICGTVISERGKGTYRQEHPKTDRSNRVIALPTSTAEALRRRMAIMRDHALDALVFCSREGTPLDRRAPRSGVRPQDDQFGSSMSDPVRTVGTGSTCLGRSDDGRPE